MRRRRVFRLVAGSVIAVAGWLILDEDPADSPAPPDSLDQPRQPDYFVENFSVDVMDEQGQRRYRLDGQEMTHFQNDDLWLIQQPRMIYFPDSGTPWHLSSDQGRAWNAVTEARLEGAVRIRREAGEDNLEANVDTSDVYLRPQDHYAETDKHAVYYRPGVRQSGVGVEGFLDRERIDLLSEVKAHYVPSTD